MRKNYWHSEKPAHPLSNPWRNPTPVEDAMLAEMLAGTEKRPDWFAIGKRYYSEQHGTKKPVLEKFYVRCARYAFYRYLRAKHPHA